MEAQKTEEKDFLEMVLYSGCLKLYVNKSNAEIKLPTTNDSLCYKKFEKIVRKEMICQKIMSIYWWYRIYWLRLTNPAQRCALKEIPLIILSSVTLTSFTTTFSKTENIILLQSSFLCRKKAIMLLCPFARSDTIWRVPLIKPTAHRWPSDYTNENGLSKGESLAKLSDPDGQIYKVVVKITPRNENKWHEVTG